MLKYKMESRKIANIMNNFAILEGINYEKLEEKNYVACNFSS